MPKDCVILTLACGKYRFNKEEFGDIGGIPRLLDVGQCNDAYSAVQIALALAGAFNCGVNDLPLSFILSWYEQKAHVILLSLLHLGIKNIKLGPALPAYLSPNVLQFLVDNFNVGQIGSADADLKAAMGQQNRCNSGVVSARGAKITNFSALLLAEVGSRLSFCGRWPSITVFRFPSDSSI